MSKLVNNVGLDYDKLVQLIRHDNVNSVEIVNLLSKENVNVHVNGIPLVLFYLKKTRHLDIDVLEAFVNHGCDLNVQDNRGKTPLHLLVGLRLNTGRKQTIEQMVSLVELFLSNGANPCLVDIYGDNVLMVAIKSHYEDWSKLIKPLIVNPKHTRQLFDETNKLGFNFVSLCIEYCCLLPVLLELKLIVKSVDTKATDEDGNNILHNLFLMSNCKYRLPWRFTEWTTMNAFQDKLPGYMFTRYFGYLVEAGANVSQKNNDGFVPFQVALNSLPPCQPRELKSLIPSKEDLSEHMPWSQSIIGLILKEYCQEPIPLPVKPGLNCSSERVMPTGIGLEVDKFELFKTVVDGGAKARFNDIIEVLNRIDFYSKERKWNERNDYEKVLCYILQHGLPDNLTSDLSDAIPNLIPHLIRCYDERIIDYRKFDELVRKKLILKIEDIRTSLVSHCSCAVFVRNASPELIVELNAECPSLFEQFIRTNQEQDYNKTKPYKAFVQAGVPVTVNVVLDLLNSKDSIRFKFLIPLRQLVQLMTDEVKVEFKETMPNAISRMVELLVEIKDDYWLLYQLIEFHKDLVDLLELLVRLGFKVTIDDLVRLFDEKLPFSTLLLLVNAIDDDLKDQISIMIPDAIGKLLSNGYQKGYWIETCAELIDTLVRLGVKVTVDHISRGLLSIRAELIPMQCLIKHLDISLKHEIQCEMPDLLINILASFLDSHWYPTNESNYKLIATEHSSLIDTTTTLLGMFELDVNYSNGTNGPLLHILICFWARCPHYRKGLLPILDNVLSRSELDIDKSEAGGLRWVLLKQYGRLPRQTEFGTEIVFRPIDMALELKQYEIAAKLIVAGANCDCLDLTKLKDNQVESLNVAKLLYTSGHYVDIEANQKLLEQLSVKSLKELASMAVGKNTSPAELNAIIEDIVWPQLVLDYLKLAHVQ